MNIVATFELTRVPAPQQDRAESPGSDQRGQRAGGYWWQASNDAAVDCLTPYLTHASASCDVAVVMVVVAVHVHVDQLARQDIDHHDAEHIPVQHLSTS